MKIVIINALILFLAATLTAMVGYGTAPDATLDNLDPSLIIIAPNGGENLYGGENTSLTWTATDWRIPLAAVQIWFSSTGGDSYQLVVGGADNTGSYSWQIPELETNEALIKIRVTDSVGNYSEQVSASVFSISHTPPAAPQFVAAQILDQTDLLISWQAVTSTVISTPMTPDGYLVFQSPDPSSEDQYLLLANVTQGCSYTHYGVVQSSPRGFYRVLAYKDFDGRVGSVLGDWEARLRPRITLADLLGLMDGPEGAAR